MNKVEADTLSPLIEEYLLAGSSHVKFVGICGPVAAGKSFLTRHLYNLVSPPVLQLPFDLWIDDDAVQRLAAPYHKRFHYSKYLCDLEALKSRKSIMVPATHPGTWRKVRIEDIRSPMLESTAEKEGTLPLRSIGKNLFHDVSDGLIYREVPSVHSGTVIIDGTLACAERARDLFDMVIFIDAPWDLRVARMIGRYLRSEQTDGVQSLWRRYVDFLVSEAQNVADTEIRAQKPGADILIDNTSNGGTDLVDISRLHQFMTEGLIPPFYHL